MTAAVQDYVKAIYYLTEREGVANTQSLASHLGTSQPAVSKMLKGLAAKGLIQHKPYYGARLTALGELVAHEVIRHHRLLERYLKEHLQFSEDEVHAQAEILEHHISEDFEDRIDQLMGFPTTCPHGRAIPPKPRSEGVR